MKKCLKILKNILIGILLVILAFQLYQAIAKKVSPEKQPTIFGFSKAVVLSDSMVPTFETGDLLIYRAQDGYEVGDVVLFFDGTNFVTHRIHAINGEEIVTKGDANNAPDVKSISLENIQGKMISILPNVGNFLAFFQTPAGIVLIAFLALLFILFPSIIAWIKGGNEEDASKDTDRNGTEE